LTAKCESYKSKVSGLVEKLDENEKLNSEQFEVIHGKYNRSKEELLKIQNKYQAAKELIEKLQKQLDSNSKSNIESEVDVLKKELTTVRNENKKLENQLSYADTKLREVNKMYDARPSTRSRDNSIVQHIEKTSLDFRSRESISSVVRGDTFPRSKETLSNDSLDSRGLKKEKSSLGLQSIPGRADRLSRQDTSVFDDSSVFKLPGNHTPGRTRQGRTVSDSRMNAITDSANKFKPPSGSGSLFSCDEEAGELFSSSYLTDLKEGNCNITSVSDRMSELSRRNTMYPPHMKSAYPVESQFCEDENVTEEGIRFSKIGAKCAPSPVSRLSLQTSNMSLGSPALSTRSKTKNSSTSYPKPVAFTVDPPKAKPGTAVRKSIGTRSSVKLSATRNDNSISSRASSTGSLARARPPRPSKQACTSDHNKHELEVVNNPSFCGLENLPLDDTMSRFLGDTDTPGKGKKRKSLGATVKSAPVEDLNMSQESTNSSMFSRTSIRSSKRLKAGNTSYTRPGPPTPGRNKSLGNLSLPRNNTSTTSLEATTSYPGVGSNTPDMSRVSTRSAASQKTPLLDTTNTPGNKSKNKSRLSKATPLNIKKALSSAFRSSNKYKLMAKQDKTINRDQSVKTTPLKSKEKTSGNIRKKLK